MPPWLADLLGLTPEPPPQPPASSPATSTPTGGGDPTGLVAAINAARAAYGLAPPLADPKLDPGAQFWAMACAKAQLLIHGDDARRIAMAHPGVPSGECLGMGEATASAMVAMWMTSPPHRAILLGDFNRVGVGLAKDANGTAWWVMDLAKV